MSQSALPSKFRLLLLAGISFLGLLPTTLLWMVNIDFAIRVKFPDWQGLEKILPVNVYQALSVYCEDLSTISTFILVLLLLFPLILALRVWKWGPQAPERLLHEIYEPYPPHFPYFLVMLGLAGTLYGLLIGLDVSGVSQLGKEGVSPDNIQQTLDQLLGGLATALLSSLVGLAGAFLAARPLTWICHLAVSMPRSTESVSLEATFHELIQDMQALGDASKDFREQMGLTELPALPQSLVQIQNDVKSLRENSEDKSFNTAVVDCLNLMQQHQRDLAAQQALQSTALLEKLSAIENQLTAQTSAQQESTQVLKAMGELMKNSLSKQELALDQRKQMLEILEQQHHDRDGDRSAIRQAFGKFLESADKGTSA